MYWGLSKGACVLLLPLLHKPFVNPAVVLFAFFIDYTWLFAFEAPQIAKHGKSSSKHIKKP